jgi:hypothetical protein
MSTSKISFEEASRIIYFVFSHDAKTYRSMMEELLMTDEPHTAIASRWQESYKQHLKDNKSSK